MRPPKLSTDYPSGLNLSYKLKLWCGMWRHSYVIEGAKGAMEFHVSQYRGDSNRPTGGLERHSTIPDGDKAPDNGLCSAVSFRPCWHDGTSLYAEEVLVPQWMECGGDHDYVFNMLLREYHKHFEEDKQ